MVGLNAFTSEADEDYQPLRVDPESEARQIARVQAVRARRDGDAVERALGRVAGAATGEENVLPPIKEALRAEATLGEVCATLRGIWGRYEPS